MRAFGATVEPVRPVSITHAEHFVNVARRRAAEAVAENGKGSGMFADQFENLANARAHHDGTGPEIWEQVKGLGLVGSGDDTAIEDTSLSTREVDNSSSMRKYPGAKQSDAKYTTKQSKTTRRFVDAFVCACGTGGTLAGVALFLKKMDKRVQIFLVDPQGSSLYNKITRGVLYTHHEAEGKRLRNPFDTITEGVGINRLTRNFSVALGDEGLFEEHEDETSHTFRDNSRQSARSTGKHDENTSGSNTPLISGAFKASDREAVEMSRFLAKRDGLFLGSSSCVNIVGATKLALQLGPGHRVVTIACDGGGRHLSKFWSAEYLEKHGLTPVARGLEFLET